MQLYLTIRSRPTITKIVNKKSTNVKVSKHMISRHTTND
ncbi:hypothetical protein OIU77_015266 [Salix suchowensis]|uniref:Uncharacterized protein n=1 Tax=Salix suchowensis TaxID=1278906 RepID=A0ABQ8ZS96_9ROSI|nr:hypothetical protein OIU77_015266 [Salix suchowensis]